jgi:hypothetical protein
MRLKDPLTSDRDEPHKDCEAGHSRMVYTALRQSMYLASVGVWQLIMPIFALPTVTKLTSATSPGF